MPPKLMESAEYSCSHPEDEVIVFLKGAALLFALVFHRMILRLIFGVIRVILQIIWFLAPLRLLLSLFRKSPPLVEPEEVPTPPASPERNGGTPAKNGSRKVTGKKN